MISKEVGAKVFSTPIGQEEIEEPITEWLEATRKMEGFDKVEIVNSTQVVVSRELAITTIFYELTLNLR